jgi:hypothetical protein
MKKVMLLAIIIGVAFVAAFGVSFAVSSNIQNNLVITKTPEGQHFEIELKERVSAKDRPNP